MHSQLKEVTQILQDGAVPYWVDSGTLIGIVREGRVMPHDKDIDLSIWAQDIDAMEAVVPQIEALGYRATRNEYAGMRYSFKFEPKDNDGLVVSIGVYRARGKSAWRMAMYGTDNPHPPGTPAFYLKGAVRTPLRYLAQSYRRIAGTHRVVGRWPWNYVLEVGTWVIPTELVAETVKHTNTGLPIPKRAEEYLAYRYGDWRTPEHDWLWYRDDHAVRLGPPDKVLRRQDAQA